MTYIERQTVSDMNRQKCQTETDILQCKTEKYVQFKKEADRQCKTETERQCQTETDIQCKKRQIDSLKRDR